MPLSINIEHIRRALEKGRMMRMYGKSFVLLCCLFAPVSLIWANDFMQGLGSFMQDISKSSVSLPKSSKRSLSPLSNSDVVAGLKDALRVGSKHVVSQLSKKNGFNGDSKIHIPLPNSMKRVKSALSAVGMGGMMDDLELRLNRAAEVATPKAKRIFGNAIRRMTIRDAKLILGGADDAATQYFRRKMSKPLLNEMKPVVDHALAQSGAVQAYDRVMGKYQSLPFMPDVKADLSQHVLNLALSGVFYYMAEEEAAIRKNPVKRTTALLKKVFQ